MQSRAELMCTPKYRFDVDRRFFLRLPLRGLWLVNVCTATETNSGSLEVYEILAYFGLLPNEFANSVCFCRRMLDAVRKKKQPLHWQRLHSKTLV